MNINKAIHFAAVLALAAPAAAADLFCIQKIEYHQRPPRVPMTLEAKKPPKAFIPFLEVRIVAREKVRTDSLFVRVHFFDEKGQHVLTLVKPSVVTQMNGQKYTMPVFLNASKAETVFFTIPAKMRSAKWQAVVVFGDEYQAAARTVPETTVLESLDYPEKRVVGAMMGRLVERPMAMDPVIEHVVRTENPKQPQITLFLRPPIGMQDATKANGVLAMCLLAGNVAEIRRKLQSIEPGQEMKGLLQFAERNKLVILCWGSRSLWNPRKSWDEQKRSVNREMDDTFDDVSRAWARGVEYLTRRYGLPSKDFLLWGISGSAQYACRLALRKPEYFLAVHVHVPSSFDKPTREANRVLWCLTTGELEAGYERSKRFYAECKTLGYPIVYKAIAGLGHGGHPVADKLGLEFFSYALSVRDQRDADSKRIGRTIAVWPSHTVSSSSEPWLTSFRSPPFVGDIINQEVFPVEQQAMVPSEFRVPLPSKAIAQAWVNR